MEIIKYTEEWKDRWDEFVLESNNGTMFHMQKFFDYHTPGKFTFNHLLFLEKNEIIALLPGAMVGDKFESPIGASYGSIVTRDVKFTRAMEIVSTLIQYAKDSNINEIELTAPPVVYENHPNQNLDFAMLWQGFSYELHYISSAIKGVVSSYKIIYDYSIEDNLEDDSFQYLSQAISLTEDDEIQARIFQLKSEVLVKLNKKIEAIHELDRSIDLKL